AARGARAVRVDAPLERGPGRDRLAPRVDRDDDALAPEPPDGLPDERGALQRGRVHGDLVGAGGAAEGAELHTLDDATVLYVEARDDALGEHGYLAPALAAAEASRRSIAPV